MRNHREGPNQMIPRPVSAAEMEGLRAEAARFYWLCRDVSSLALHILYTWMAMDVRRGGSHEAKAEVQRIAAALAKFDAACDQETRATAQGPTGPSQGRDDE